MSDNYFNAEFGFDCSYGIECRLTRKEFITYPLYGRESIRFQSASGLFGRNDYLPFAKVKTNGIGFDKHWSKLNIYGEFQRSNVLSPSDSSSVDASPDFDDREYSIGVNSNSMWFDALGVEYSTEESAAKYLAGVPQRSEIPNLFETQLFKLSFDKRVWRGITGKLLLSSVGQKYVIPKFGDSDDLRSKVSFVDVNVSLGVSPYEKCEVKFVVHNALNNNKNYIEGYVADFISAEQAATLDRFFTERVLSLSVKLGF